MASGRVTCCTVTCAQLDLVRTSCAMHAGEKTAATSLRLRFRSLAMALMRSERESAFDECWLANDIESAYN